MCEIDSEQGKETLGGHLVACIVVKSNQSMIECSRARERTTSRDKADIARVESEGKTAVCETTGVGIGCPHLYKYNNITTRCLTGIETRWWMRQQPVGPGNHLTGRGIKWWMES